MNAMLNQRWISSDSDKKDVLEKKKTKKKITASTTQDRFIEFKDEDSPTILDVDSDLFKDQNEEFYLYQEKKLPDFQDIDLTRGKKGVFDVEQLVHLLRSENMVDIVVIQLPPQVKYCDHMVIVTGLSPRQLDSFCEYFLKIYKKKKRDDDPFVRIDGHNKSDFTQKRTLDWMTVDMGNIVLHLFLKQTREFYDIETLWTVGEQYDDQTQRPVFDPVVDLMEKHIKFLDEIKTSEEQ